MHRKFELLLLLLTLQLVLYHFGRELEKWQIPLLVTARRQRRELAFPQGSCQTSCLLALLVAWGRLGGLVKLIRKRKENEEILITHLLQLIYLHIIFPLFRRWRWR